jgi:hypothetical protein
LFVSDALPALIRKFQVAEKDPSGKMVYSPVRVGKAGLMHDVIKWTVPKGTTLTP